MNATQTRRIALSLAVATPSIMQSIPASATIASPTWSAVNSERGTDSATVNARLRLLDAITKMSAERKQAVGGDRLILAADMKVKGKSNAACATHGIWCRGGSWSNGCTCALTRRITKKPKG